MVNSKIMIEDIDEFLYSSGPNKFNKYEPLRDIRIIDDFMVHQEPGKYKITIQIEKVIK